MGTVNLHISPQHPAFAGHFPGAPIVPGALLLDEAMHALAAVRDQDAARCEIAAAKFLSVVRPGEALSIEYERCEDGWITFVISAPNRAVASGKLSWASVVLDMDREV